MTSWEDDQFAATLRGENPRVLAEMASGWAVIGDDQRLPGYSLLLHRGDVDQLTELGRAERAQFLADLALLGEAVADVCSALDSKFRRVNYAIMGNKWKHLHGHVHPRYDWEPAARRDSPVWIYPPTDDRDAHQLAGDGHRVLRQKLSSRLTELVAGDRLWTARSSGAGWTGHCAPPWTSDPDSLV